jgi:alpha/beta superfamily hydrolase
VGFIYCAEATATAQSVVSYYAPDPRRDTPNLLSRINKPILIVAGSMDTVVEGLESRVAPLADGATTQLIVIEGADHFFRDLYADELVESALEFMGVQ